MIEAHIGGLIFQGGDQKAEYTLRGGDGLKGWLAGVGSRFQREDRPTAIGQTIGRRLLGGRLVTLQGAIHAASPQEMEQRIMALNSLGIDGGALALKVIQPMGTTFADVYRDGEPSVEIVTWPVFARYQATFFAPNPRRYGDLHEPPAAATVTMVNRGNYEATPSFRVTGDAPAGYTLTDGTRQFVVTRALQPGIRHDIDMADGSLRVGGARVTGGVARADLLTIPPNRLVATSPGLLTVSAGGPLVKPKWHDTWM